MNKINAALIIEVIGKPPEHLTKKLKEISEKINEESGIEIANKKINEPGLIAILQMNQENGYVPTNLSKSISPAFSLLKYNSKLKL